MPPRQPQSEIRSPPRRKNDEIVHSKDHSDLRYGLVGSLWNRVSDSIDSTDADRSDANPRLNSDRCAADCRAHQCITNDSANRRANGRSRTAG
jgi:hypothetical protein